MKNFTKALNKIAVQKKNLSQSESMYAFEEIMSGAIDEIQITAFMTALKMKGECIDEIVGAALALRRNAHFVNSGGKFSIDTCGTGGDGLDTFNISTTSSFIVAGAGISVAKHGNRAATSKCGSADVLAQLGFNLDVKPSIMEHCLQENGIAFLFAPRMHPTMKIVANIRKKLGFRTIFNLLGPLINPAGAPAQVIGVFDNAYIEVLAECLNRLGSSRALIVHGNDGLDEISATSNTRVCELKNGKRKIFEFDPQKYFTNSNFEEIKGSDAKFNAEITLNVLNGSLKNTCRNICLLNAAAGIMVASEDLDFDKALTLAKESLDSGKALEKLQKLIEFSKQ